MKKTYQYPTTESAACTMTGMLMTSGDKAPQRNQLNGMTNQNDTRGW